MESTAMGFVRGVVILAFVLGLPAIALFGVPDEARDLLESEYLPWNSATPTSPAGHENDASEPDSSALTNDLNNDQSQQPSFFARSTSIQASHESEVNDDAASQVALASAEARVLHRPLYRPLGAGENSEVVRHVPSSEMLGGQSGVSRSDAHVVQAIERQLQSLGAVSYQLQQRSSEGKYRFVCLCQNDRNEQRTFEATSVDRLQAMQIVLDQVTTWRSDNAANLNGGSVWR